jgi:hypothetical protein
MGPCFPPSESRKASVTGIEVRVREKDFIQYKIGS